MRLSLSALIPIAIAGGFLQPAAAQLTQQGNKLVGSGAIGTSYQGEAVAISGDGNTAIVGGYGDSGKTGAAWIYTRTNGVWTQQGNVAFLPGGADTGTLDLVDDAGDAGGPYSYMVLPAAGTVSNGQCSIAGAGSSVTSGGNTLTLTLAITFSQSFASNRVIYLAARSNTQNSGWQAVGTVAAQ